MNEARAIIDARMTATSQRHGRPARRRLHVPERPGQQQDVWQPSQRDSQEIHFIGGLPKLKTVGVEGPYNVTGVSSTPSRERLFVCQPPQAAAADGDRRACAQRILPNLAQARLSASGDGGGPRGAAGVLHAGARGRRHLRRRHPRRRRARSSPARRSSTGSSAIPPGLSRAPRTPRQRRRAGVAAVVLPLEQHPGRALLNLADRRPAPRSRRARRAKCGA